MPKPSPSLVRVYPLDTAPIEGVPHIVQDVDAATAAILTAPISRHTGTRGVFTADPRDIPAWYTPPDPDGLLSPTPPAVPDAAPSPVEA